MQTVNRQNVESLGYRHELRHVSLTDSRGKPVRCRVNGKCQTWKTRPGEFRLPVKYGLKECFYITPDNAKEWIV